MLKRLIEVALPLKEVSEQSAREKAIRHGHISTLHLWWARRPLAACRAAVFASLIPDPDDPDCPDEFRAAVKEILGRSQFTPKNGNGSTVEDTPRNRCLEFIKHLVRWENSNNPDYIDPARKLIAAAHKYLRPDAKEDLPYVLDPFAGGGAIPLEALRLGCKACAVELNPVAHLIELCTLVYPQKYGQPDSRPVPDYIRQVIDHNRARKRANGESDLFDTAPGYVVTPEQAIDIPDIEMSEEQYFSNPLATEVRYWGNWLATVVDRECGHLYPLHGDAVPVAYLWAKTVTCPNPSCGSLIPCINQLWLCKKRNRRVALRLVPNEANKKCYYEVVEGKDITFDADNGTMQRGSARCPFCEHVAPGKYIREESSAGRLGHQLMAVVSVKPNVKGKRYSIPTESDAQAMKEASDAFTNLKDSGRTDLIPDEKMSGNAPRRISPPLYGIHTFGELFNPRQSVVLGTFVRHMHDVMQHIRRNADPEYATAVGTYLAMALDRAVESNTTLGRWIPVGEKPAGAYGRQALPMVWDYCEVNLLRESPRRFADSVEWVSKCITHISAVKQEVCNVLRTSSTGLPLTECAIDVVLTDPPYYDAVPYSALSDFFYVWLKRTVGTAYADSFRTPLTPKGQEITEQRPHRSLKERKDAAFYERMMGEAFSEMQRVLSDQGITCVMFAHKSTTAWEALIGGLLRSGLIVTASWPFHTERPGRMTAMGTAALASSVTIVCRKRSADADDGLWDDVRQELKIVAKERLDFFWEQGIRGADFFISAIGPALSVFGRYARVIRISGEEVTVGEFLDEVRSLVTNYALTKILKTTNTANIDPESRFYVVWKWSYGDAKVPADESFKLAQALGIDTEEMWDKTGVLTKSGENVQCLPVEKRMKVKDLGEPEADGTPASLIDVLHRMCAFRDKGDNAGMAQFLGRSGQARNSALWLIAQAVSEILPDGEREKQLMQGLLNQKEGLEEATRQGELF